MRWKPTLNHAKGIPHYYTEMKTTTIIALALSLLTFASASDKFVRRDVPVGGGLNLKEFGGPDIVVSVFNDGQSFVGFVGVSVADYTKLVPVAHIIKGDDGYSSEISMEPTVGGSRVEKKNGTPFPGTRFEMYLLHSDKTSGIRVYFLDTISAMNHNTVVIAVPDSTTPRIPPSPPQSAPANAEPKARETSDDVVSPELLTWYFRLQKSRQSLDITDSAAVARFNQSAADYHNALKQARARIKPQ